MKYLLTGGAGFIGSHFCENVLRNGHTVIAIDNFNDYYNPEIKRQNCAAFKDNPQVELIDGDILDTSLLDKLFEKNDFDVIVHLAARAGVRPSLSQPLLYERVNIQGTMELLQRAQQSGTPKFVMASSSPFMAIIKKCPSLRTIPLTTQFPRTLPPKKHVS